MPITVRFAIVLLMIMPLFVSCAKPPAWYLLTLHGAEWAGRYYANNLKSLASCYLHEDRVEEAKAAIDKEIEFIEKGNINQKVAPDFLRAAQKLKSRIVNQIQILKQSG